MHRIKAMYCIIFLVMLFQFSIAQNAEKPADYKLLYENSMGNASLDNFEVTDPKSWRIQTEGDNKVLELFGKSEYAPRVRSPLNILLIKDHLFGSFVLEADLKQTGQEYAHRDLCIFWGMKDPANFYYVHLASTADEHAHNIFLVNDEPRKAIATKTSGGVKWAQEWHKVKIIRDIETGSVKIFFDDMNIPIMEAIDHHFDYGYIGFGSFDDTGMFDNIKIWGEKEYTRKSFFDTGK